uniref:Uncharacterized protein n=1 Tax=viral metagenome TaxID=1070528 RepID=A0A6C0IDD0_9ZZZZ
MSSLQLTDINKFNTNNLVFSKPDGGNIDKIKFKRIRVATRYPDGGVGDLIIATPPGLHCFGLQESRDLGSNAINGYSLPLCLWSRNGPTDDEKKFTDTFTAIADHCKKYLLEHRDEIEKYDLDASDLKKFNPLFWKMEKGKVVEGRGPMLYAKAILNKKLNKISTIFVNEETNEQIDPFEMMNKICSVTAAIKIESIFIGNKISLQVKLFEVVYRMREMSMRGLLRPNAQKLGASSSLLGNAGASSSSSAPSYAFDAADDYDEDAEDEDSIVLEEEVNTTTLPVQNVPVVVDDDEEEEEDEEVVEEEEEEAEEDEAEEEVVVEVPPPKVVEVKPPKVVEVAPPAPVATPEVVKKKTVRTKTTKKAVEA